MRRVAFFTAAILSALAGCAEHDDVEPIPQRTVAEVAALVRRGEAVAVDANAAPTWREHGVIPGARLLSSSSSFDPERELPSDRAASLVFYCANTDCRASDGAAARARVAGYSDVSVMREGIAGWVAAGQAVERPGG